MKNKKMILMGVICALSLGLAVTTHANKNADLRTAAECGDLNGVKTALNRGAYVNDADMDDDTALILAIRNNRMNVVKYLVQEVEGAKCCGSGPMNEAYEQHNIKMMQYLLDNGISKISDPQGKIEDAIYFNHFETAKFLFDNYEIRKKRFYDYVRKQCEDYKEADICKLIDLNIIQQTDELYTYAFNKGYTRVCDKLKSIKGDEIKLDLSNKEAKDKVIRDALDRCDKKTLTAVINSGYVDNINDLFGYLYLPEFDKNKDFRTIEFLINEMGADIDSLCHWPTLIPKKTILFQAISDVCLNLVNYLLDHNANIYIKGTTKFDSQEKHYDTALKYAKYWSKEILKDKYLYNDCHKSNIKEIVKLLEEAEKKNPNPNAKPKKKSFFGKLFSKKSDKKTSTTPVSQKSAAPTVETDSPSATQTSTEPIKKPSITQKSLPVTSNAPTAPQASNINVNNDEATYQLFYGIDHDQFLCVKKAVDNNKDCVNATNRDGKTPLMLAVEKEQKEIIKFLIHNGADVNASFLEEIRPGYRRKTTVFMLAKNPEIRQILSREGAVG